MIPETMADWVKREAEDSDGNPYSAHVVAERLKTVDLLLAQSETTLQLATSMTIAERCVWEAARFAVCEELAVRLDKARGAFDDVPTWRK